MKVEKSELLKQFPILEKMADEQEILWINPDKTDFETGMKNTELTMTDIEDAEARLARFAPFIMK